VQFPICRAAADWAKVKWVNEIHPELRDRIECIQPYHYAPSGTPSALSLLHDLDIRDKHRENVSLELEFTGTNLRLQNELEDGEPDSVPHVELEPNTDLRDGAKVGTIHAGGQVKGETGRLYLRPIFKVWVEHTTGRLPLSEVVRTLVTDCDTVLAILHQGKESVDERTGGAPWHTS
jgi:hypothetical protein